MNNRQRGFSLIELLIVVTIIGIIAAVAIPNLLAARRSANEGSAIGAMKTLHGAQLTYASSFGNGSYAGTIAGTGDSVALSQLGTPGAMIIDQTMDTGIKAGYVFVGGRTATTAGGQGTFFFSANPTVTSGITQTGARRFGISTDGVVVADVSTANLPTAFNSTTVLTASPLNN